MSDVATPQLQIILPVHNEGSSIEATVREWYDQLSPLVRLQFVVSEDGSKDNTKEVLTRLSRELPMLLDMTDERRGYAGAVVTAFRHTTAPYTLAVDSDGQCDPADFAQLWQRRDEADVVIGWRVHRGDTTVRKIMSGSFRLLHGALFRPGIHDPSCPYLLIQRRVLDRLVPHLGVCREGFWWEFTGRTVRAGFKLLEVPIHHRVRTSGSTVVFRPSKIPRIALRNGVGLFKVWWQTRRR